MCCMINGREYWEEERCTQRHQRWKLPSRGLQMFPHGPLHTEIRTHTCTNTPVYTHTRMHTLSNTHTPGFGKWGFRVGSTASSTLTTRRMPTAYREALHLECWASNRKVASLNPWADRVKSLPMCPWARHLTLMSQGSPLILADPGRDPTIWGCLRDRWDMQKNTFPIHICHAEIICFQNLWKPDLL